MLVFSSAFVTDLGVIFQIYYPNSNENTNKSFFKLYKINTFAPASETMKKIFKK